MKVPKNWKLLFKKYKMDERLSILISLFLEILYLFFSPQCPGTSKRRKEERCVNRRSQKATEFTGGKSDIVFSRIELRTASWSPLHAHFAEPWNCEFRFPHFPSNSCVFITRFCLVGEEISEINRRTKYSGLRLKRKY